MMRIVFHSNGEPRPSPPGVASVLSYPVENLATPAVCGASASHQPGRWAAGPLALSFAFLATSALAEAPPPPAAPGKPADVQGLTVVGGPPPVQNTIDRRSYSVRGDLLATTGSIADALRNIPSVDVDVQGKITLRGDPSVTILIDGHPAASLRGASRAQALQSLSASQIDRVEVITNPSAEFKAEGAGGVINLITRKTRAPGYSGSVHANLGVEGRWNTGASGAFTKKNVTVSGDVSLREDVFKLSADDHRSTAGGGADPSGFSDATSTRRDAVNVASGRVGVDINLTPKTHVSGDLRVVHFEFSSPEFSTYDQISNGTRAAEYAQIGRSSRSNTVIEGGLHYRYTPKKGEEFNIDIARDRTTEDRDHNVTTMFVIPVLPLSTELRSGRDSLWYTDGKLSYSRSGLNHTTVKLGYEFEDSDDRFLELQSGTRIAGPTTVMPVAISDVFAFRQQVNSVYGSIERPFGHLTVLAGLRAEAVTMDLHQRTLGASEQHDYIRAFPSLHLTEDLGSGRQLSASYARRIQRPNPRDFDPFVVEQDPRNLRAGNPNLKPQITDSYEVGYVNRGGRPYLAVTAYVRESRDVVTDLTRDIGNDILLTTKTNIGRSRTAGLETVVVGRLPFNLSYRLSSDLQWQSIQAADLGLGSDDRSTWSPSARGSLTWQATPDDQFQLSGSTVGKRLFPQGFDEPYSVANLGYKHKVDDRLNLVVTAQDLFGTLKARQVIQTPRFTDVVNLNIRTRAIFVGFTYSLGGRQRDEGFDFGGLAPPK